MSIDELAGVFATGQGAVTVSLVLVGVLWVVRHIRGLKEQGIGAELAASVPVYILFVLAGLRGGKGMKEMALMGAVIVLGPLFSSSPALTSRSTGDGDRDRS